MFESLKSLFTGSHNETKAEKPRGSDGLEISNIHDRAYRELGQSKYGSPKYQIFDRSTNIMDYEAIRHQARNIYGQSTLAHGLVGTQLNTVIGVGITWESNPEWIMLDDVVKDWDDNKRYEWTQKLEGMMRLVFKSKELDIKQQLNFETQLQRLLYVLGYVDGELFIVMRYYKDTLERMSPLTLQILNPDQIQTPYGSLVMSAVQESGGEILDGVEFDKNGVPVAIHVLEELGKPTVRIPFFGSDGRRFVIHYKRVDTAHQVRGVSPLDPVAYDLNKLEEYDIGEMEAAATQSVFVGAVESQVQAQPNRNPRIDLAGVANNQGLGRSFDPNAYKPGIKDIRVGKKSIILNNLAPGYTFKGFQPTRPNPNYSAFVEVREKRICNSGRIVHSVYAQEFKSSFSASRMEVNAHWLQVVPEAEDFAQGVIEPVRRAIFEEWVRMGKIEAPGYKTDVWRKEAWNQGYYNGVPKPSVDGVKEANEYKLMKELGALTGEKIAKRYNKSDWRENITKVISELQYAKDHGFNVSEQRLVDDIAAEQELEEKRLDKQQLDEEDDDKKKDDDNDNED